jgi:LTXXQ motif family protein
MWKSAVVATAALAIAGSTIVYAQQREGYGDSARFEHHHRHLSAEDRAAFVDARIAALKAGLQLTPDQEKNWPAFEQSVRELAKLRAERRALRQARELGQSDAPKEPFDRLAERADNMAKASAALKHIAEAGKPLYMSLNDSQKERFHKLAHFLRPHRRYAFNEERRGWRHGEGNDGRDGEQGGRFWHQHRSGTDDNGQGGRMEPATGKQL